MQLKHGIHLAYCTNIHPAETWTETLGALERHTLRVRDRVMPARSPAEPYAIGLRLSDAAARELAQPAVLRAFRGWLERHGCYVFTINGFPYGRFHGTRVKEGVYRPDWSEPARLEYTCRLASILAALLPAAPPGCEGSISTLPGSFKGFQPPDDQQAAMRHNLWRCVEHLADCSGECGRAIHLGLEPEPLGLFENTAETCAFFERMDDECPTHLCEEWRNHLRLNYDVCHFACEYEEPDFDAFAARGIRISKIHLSAALTVRPGDAALGAFSDDVYLHQVVARQNDGTLHRYLDLPVALGTPSRVRETDWRVHFHLPLQWAPDPGEHQPLGTTAPSCVRALALLAGQPSLWRDLEIETYTWQVLPPFLRTLDVVEQIAGEYGWTLRTLKSVGLL